jgi:hypothetical protein
MGNELFQVRAQLERAGFSFHTGEPHQSMYVGKWWYCWCGPTGKWDVECGDEFSSIGGAVCSALDCLIDYTSELQGRIEGLEK